MEFFKLAQRLELQNSRVAAFGSTRKPGITVNQDSNVKALLESGAKTITIVGKAWDFHVLRALETTLEENLNMIRETISYLKDKDLEVIFDAEHFFDGYKNNQEYALQVLQTATNAGVDWLVLCDTNGGSMPWEIATVIQEVQGNVSIPLGIHAHNDSGCAVSNSLVEIGRASCRERV